MEKMLLVIPGKTGAAAESGKSGSSLTERLFMKNIFKWDVAARLFLNFKRKELESGICKVSPGKVEPFLLMTLPLSETEINGLNKAELERFLKKVCRCTGADGIFLPPYLRQLINCDVRGNDHDVSRALLRALLAPVVEELHKRNEIRIGSIDLVVISGGDEAELLYYLTQVEPYFGYAVIAAEDKITAEIAVKPLAEETGLTVSLTDDIPRALKGARLAINLGDPSQIEGLRVRANSILINLNSQKITRMQGNGVVINGVTCSMPKEFYDNLPERLTRYFPREELCEIFLLCSASLAGKETSKGDEADFRQLRLLYDRFVELGCSLKGLVGYKRVLDIKDVVLRGARTE
jgi:hypothetical protein